eukprot:RCo007209
MNTLISEPCGLAELAPALGAQSLSLQKVSLLGQQPVYSIAELRLVHSTPPQPCRNNVTPDIVRELESLRIEMRDLQTLRNSLGHEAEDQNREILCLKERLQCQSQSFCASESEKGCTIAKLSAEIESLRSAWEQLKAENMAYRATAEAASCKVVCLEREVQEQHARLEAARKETECLQATARQATQQRDAALSELAKKESEVQALRCLLEKQREMVAIQLSETERLKQGEAVMSCVVAEKAALEARCSCLEHEVKGLREAQQAEKASLQAARCELSSSQAHFQQLRAENDEKAHFLESALQQNALLREKVGELQAQGCDLDKEKAKSEFLRMEVADLEAQLRTSLNSPHANCTPAEPSLHGACPGYSAQAVQQAQQQPYCGMCESSLSSCAMMQGMVAQAFCRCPLDLALSLESLATPALSELRAPVDSHVAKDLAGDRGEWSPSLSPCAVLDKSPVATHASPTAARTMSWAGLRPSSPTQALSAGGLSERCSPCVYSASVPALGVDVAARKLGSKASHVIISSVHKGGSAELAGLLPDDEIVRVEGLEVSSVEALVCICDRLKPLSTAVVEYVRRRNG